MSIFSPKVSSKDFQESSLPSTRKEVFFDVVKLHWLKLLFCGILFFAVSLIFVFTTIGGDFYETAIQSAVEKGEMAGEQGISSIMIMHTVLYIVDFVGCLIFGLVLSGVVQVIKMLAWEEPVRIFHELGKGIKQNIKHYLLLSFFFGLLLFACRYSILVSTNFLGWLPAIVCILIPAPMAAYMLVTIPIYDVKFTQQMRYAMLVYSKNKLRTILAFFLCMIPFILTVISEIFINTIATVIFQGIAFFALPFVLLAWFAFAYDRLDKTINEKFYPDLVGRGLHLTEYDDDSSWLDY